MNKHVPQLDWKAYYNRFAEIHGGNPLQWKGWLLFPDGWRYSSTSYQGPEMPPQDEEQAKELRLVYWKMRLASVSKERRELRASLVGLEMMERTFSAPLQQRIVRDVPARNEFGDEVTRKVPGACDLDLEGLRGRLGWLEDDVEQCERVIKELSDAKAVEVVT
jgi:hypothetical protein